MKDLVGIVRENDKREIQILKENIKKCKKKINIQNTLIFL